MEDPPEDQTFDAQCTIVLNKNIREKGSNESLEDDQDGKSFTETEDEEEEEEDVEEVEEKSLERPTPSPSCRMFSREDKLSEILKELDDISIFEFSEAFDLFDLNNDGIISHSDLKNTLVSLGEMPSDEEITRMMSEAPKPLDIEGFIKFMACRTLQMDSEAILTSAISHWDPEKTGLVSLNKLKHELMSHGDRFTEEEVQHAFEQAPTKTLKGRTMIEYQPLCKAICGVRRS